MTLPFSLCNYNLPLKYENSAWTAVSPELLRSHVSAHIETHLLKGSTVDGQVVGDPATGLGALKAAAEKVLPVFEVIRSGGQAAASGLEERFCLFPKRKGNPQTVYKLTEYNKATSRDCSRNTGYWAIRRDHGDLVLAHRAVLWLTHGPPCSVNPPSSPLV